MPISLGMMNRLKLKNTLEINVEELLEDRTDHNLDNTSDE